MKKVILGLLVVSGVSLLTANGQSADTSRANSPYEWSSKVQKTHGLAWFILAEPLRSYEVMTTFEMSYPKRHTPSLNIKQIQYILKHKSRSLSEKYPGADGLLLTDGAKVQVIRYTDEVERHARIANVQTIGEKQIYLWAEALKVNKNAFSVPYNGSLPLTNDYLKDGMEQLVEKAKQMASANDQNFDALLIKGANVQAIRYFNPGQE